MKQTNIIQGLSLFLFALVLAAPTWAQNVSGNKNAPGNEDYFNIASKEDWKTFCDRVKGGETGLNAKMTADVDLGADIMLVGTNKQRTEQHHYTGTFDGQGHTLKMNWDCGAAHYIAPFYYVKDATIRNLRTEGQITSKGFFLSGMIYQAHGKTTVSGCISDVKLTSSYGYKACGLAGLIQFVYQFAQVTITDCIVMGTIDATTGKGNNGMAGFVYDNYGNCTMKNCLYLGTNNASSEDGNTSKTFGPNIRPINCYYLNPCGKEQGEKLTDKKLRSGEITKLLQADRTDRCYWAQVLGEKPSFYNEADKAKTNYVYYDTANSRWACDNLKLTEDSPLSIGLDFTAAKVDYNRQLSDGKTTICLPYDLPIQGFKAYALSGADGSTLHFNEVKGTLEAYHPYLLVANAPTQLSNENMQVRAFNEEALKTTVGDFSFVGTVNGVTNAVAVMANAYILQSDGKFQKARMGADTDAVAPYHACILAKRTAGNTLSVVLESKPTGIDGVTNDANATDGAVYNLRGQRVADRLDANAHNHLPAGIYIVAGRKVVIK